ncbi:50S ribosomal protein L17 [candidate division KSB3 bacterium]|uniref:Large ribosomal subunit protein bL17 n=1 Tax=candidate division KSB3 bacterium TaxID=2044937 RepID=A0A2G6E2K3_9BACT|nr:MAG: 50S ribosomal protein L17 [candidate division KSB3 bacterium]PIE28570.1 MAG: 50S ribosomal protein L17 [candidate division KSB3 bacterium]
MRHRKAGKKLSRNASHRRALLRNLVTELLRHGRIKTTLARAKALRSPAEKMITLGKRGDLHARRQALSYIQSKDVVHELFDTIAAKYTDRHGGYTRIFKLGQRKGDAAPIAIIELVED